MKVNKILFFCCIVSVNAMEMVQKNNQFEIQILSDLEDSKINLMGKYILEFCCSDGRYSYLMAQKVGQEGLVLGVDANKDMIDVAQVKYKQQKNLSFHASSIKEFKLVQSFSQFNVITLFNYFDLLSDQLNACKKIYECLKPGGDFLVNVGPGKEPLDIQVSREMIQNVPLMSGLLSSFGIEHVFQSSYSTEQKYKEILQVAGFDIVSFKEKKRCLIFKDRDEFAAIKRPIAQGRPIVQSIPSWIFEYAFNKFIEQFLTHLETNDEGQLIYRFDEILIHARKPDEKIEKK